jgi:hypothetical protein
LYDKFSPTDPNGAWAERDEALCVPCENN